MRILALSLGVMLPVMSPLHAQTLPGVYTNSWVGNTYGTPADHIAHNIDNIYVTPSGKVATITDWDEGGTNAAIYSSTGAKIGVPVESGTGSWGRHSGRAVFVDDNYLYQSMRQDTSSGVSPNPDHTPPNSTSVWKCIRRYNHDGSPAPFTGGKGYDSAMLVINSDGSKSMPTGVVIYNGELYVSDPNTGRIKVYNASTMSQTPVRSFSIANVGLLDFDRLGSIWMLNTVQKKLIRFSRTGAIRSQSITFPAGVVPTSFCIDKVNDRILVTNNGNGQNVLIYTNIFSTPSQTSTFGNTGGINSGTAGAIAPLKFSEPKGVGIDSSGNIFVANNGVTVGGADYSQGGGRLEKYNSGGTLQWTLNGTIFTANGDLNPSDETEFYTHEHKFKLNLGNTTPGSEWSLAAQTVNKVKYPSDPRIPIAGGINKFWTTAYVRNVFGRKLLYVSDMYGSFLLVYRFNSATDGETAIPSGRFSSENPATLWRDANGNGANDSGETESSTADNFYSTQVFPDANGGVWKANRDNATNRIRYFPLQGFDGYGNPQYTYASSVGYTPSELADVKRLEYDAANDVLYAAGRSSDLVSNSVWSSVGDRLVRYNNFLGTRSTAWSIALPYSTTSPESNLNVKAIAEAGDYLFLAAVLNGRIYVHKKSDGSKVGEILPTSATGNSSGWSDINGAVRATKRSNGEYLIFAEENGKGKIMMYRWNPTPGVTPTPTPTPTVGANLITNPSFDAEAFDTQTPSDWTEWEPNVTSATSSYTEANGGSNSGARHGTHYKTAAYQVYTSQTKTGLANGLYTLRVWAKSSGGQSECYLEAKDFGGTTRTANLPVSSTYQLVEIKDINVTNGQATIGIWSNAYSGNWCYFDDVEFFKQ